MEPPIPGEKTPPENEKTMRDEPSEAAKEQDVLAHELNSQADVISADDAG